MLDLPPATAARDREPALRRTLRRLTRHIDRGADASAQFTRWRLVVFVAGAAAPKSAANLSVLNP